MFLSKSKFCQSGFIHVSNQRQKLLNITSIHLCCVVFFCRLCRVCGSKGPHSSSHIPCREFLAGLRWRRESWSVALCFYAIDFKTQIVRILMKIFSSVEETNTKRTEIKVIVLHSSNSFKLLRFFYYYYFIILCAGVESNDLCLYGNFYFPVLNWSELIWTWIKFKWSNEL